MWLGLAGLCAAVLSLAGIFLYLDPQIPKPETYRNVKLETPLRVYGDSGELLAEFGEKRRRPLAIEDTPDILVNAFLAAEEGKAVDMRHLLQAAKTECAKLERPLTEREIEGWI